jgi:hypothetical protein
MPPGFSGKVVNCPIARAILIGERFARTTEQHGGAALLMSNLDDASWVPSIFSK